ncbi:MAG TPA: glycosyltransferase family 39 protein [Solirubrobacterales bacterium]|nr:glycosyltransferase family 39 protein [Solirubrobacterales bacterium]
MTRSSCALLGITAAAAVVRFATLDVQSFDHDEAVTAIRVIHPSLVDTLSVVGDSERSPPLYYVLVWGWSKVFGTGEVGLRSLSALFGTLTVPLAYAAAARFGSSRRVALYAAAFVALNPYLVWYSQEARSYALMVLFATGALLYFARSLERPSPASLALWALASALALSSHYFAAFLIVPQALWLLLRSESRHRAMLATAAIAAVGLALVPLAANQEEGGRRNGFTETALASRVGETGLNFVASEEPAPFAGDAKTDAVQLVAAAGGALLLAAAIGLIATRASRAERAGAVAAGAVGGGALALPLLLAVVGTDFINPRNLIGALVPLLIVLAIGFGCRGAGKAGLAGGAATCALFVAVLLVVDVSAQMQRPDWRGAAEALASPAESRVLVVPRNGDDALAYYLGAGKQSLGSRLRTREIDVLSTNYRVKDPPEPFELVHEERRAPFFLLWRYRARRPQPIRLRDLAGRRVLSERSAVLIER